MTRVRQSGVKSIVLAIAAAAFIIPATSPARAATVKEVFEKYNLVGTLASDCSKPADAKTPYLTNRLIDADHVELDKMVGPTSRQSATIVDKATESKPNELTLSATIDDKRYDLVVQVEHGRMRAMESTRATGQKDIAGGRFTAGGAETPWYGRCLQKVTIHSAPEGGGKCIQPLNGEIKAGVRLAMWDCNDTPPQIFAFDTLNGSLTIGDFCIDTDGSRGQPGVQLPLALCNGGPSQVWKTKASGNYVEILGINDLCVDISNYSKDNLAAVGLWNCHDQSNQRWQFSPALDLTLEESAGYDGHQIAEFNLPGADAKLCQTSCIYNRQCTAWRYRKPEGRTDHNPHCWLLDKTNNVRHNDPMLISGAVRPEPPK